MYNTDLPTRAELPSSKQLLRSTALAAAVATGLLIATILPAEYGIDPTGAGRALGLTQMGEIKVALATEANAAEQKPEPVAVAPVAVPVEPPAAAPARVAAAEPTIVAPEPQAHTVRITLKNGEAAEIKLTMNDGAVVDFEWSADAPVNLDTHGDPHEAPKDFYHGYGKGRNKMNDAGKLTAAFDGKHGWFWRNRSGAVATVTLKTRGDYGQIERVL